MAIEPMLQPLCTVECLRMVLLAVHWNLCGNRLAKNSCKVVVKHSHACAIICLFVCVCVCVCVCVYYMHVHVCVHACVCLIVCMYASVGGECMHLFVFTNMCMDVFEHLNTYIHMYGSKFQSFFSL